MYTKKLIFETLKIHNHTNIFVTLYSLQPKKKIEN